MDRANCLLSSLPAGPAAQLRAAFRAAYVPQAAVIVEQGGPSEDEILLLAGLAAAHISDPDGRRICTGLFAAPCIVTPHIARTQDGISHVTIEMLAPGAVARLPASRLQDLMVADADIRAWGNAALHAELVARSAREWALAALPAKERLIWFRQAHPGAEGQFPHHLIAAYLGMTPVTLSRLRKAAG